MDYGITPEDREKMRHISEQNFSGKLPEPDYEPIEDFENLEVRRAENRYKIEYGDTSIRISANRIDHICLSNFIEDYIDTQDFHEAQRLNYKGKSQKAEEFIPVLEADEDLTQDLSRLAQELDPRD